MLQAPAIVRLTGPRLLIALLALSVSGCETLGPNTRPATLERAQTFAERGDAAAAAREYAGLARDNPGTGGNEFLLAAARQWLLANRPEDAARALGELREPLRAPQDFARRLINVDLSLARGRGPEAWSTLEAMDAPPAGGEVAFHELRQRVAFATGRPAEGVRAQLAGERFMATEEQRFESRRLLFRQLRDAGERGIKLEPQAAAREPIVQGWLELGPIAALAASRGGVAPALASWRARYPKHPGAALIGTELTDSAGGSGFVSGSHVAVLLPLGGRTAGAAAQIRDGLLAAVYGSALSPRPTVRFYDTSTTSIYDSLREATVNGAEFIIGPLTRDEVIAAADFNDRRPALLALNYLPADRSGPSDFYQYALSPENEARSVAQRALSEGRRRAIALVPEGDWGQRVAAAFQDELERGGGRVLSTVEYFSGGNDYSEPIQSALRLTDSRARLRRLENVLGTSLEFQPRRRSDIDFIFAPAQAGIARQLRPQLRFHYAGDIPTYSTSDAYDPGLAVSRDLDGLIFPDMPWMLASDADSSRLPASSREAWSNRTQRTRLFAFGHDAWLIYEGLRSRTLSAGAGSLAGVTGSLSLDPERRIVRGLDWAQIQGGSVRLLD